MYVMHAPHVFLNDIIYRSIILSMSYQEYMNIHVLLVILINTMVQCSSVGYHKDTDDPLLFRTALTLY